MQLGRWRAATYQGQGVAEGCRVMNIYTCVVDARQTGCAPSAGSTVLGPVTHHGPLAARLLSVHDDSRTSSPVWLPYTSGTRSCIWRPCMPACTLPCCKPWAALLVRVMCATAKWRCLYSMANLPLSCACEQTARLPLPEVPVTNFPALSGGGGAGTVSTQPWFAGIWKG